MRLSDDHEQREWFWESGVQRANRLIAVIDGEDEVLKCTTHPKRLKEV